MSIPVSYTTWIGKGTSERDKLLRGKRLCPPVQIDTRCRRPFRNLFRLEPGKSRLRLLRSIFLRCENAAFITFFTRSWEGPPGSPIPPSGRSSIVSLTTADSTRGGGLKAPFPTVITISVCANSAARTLITP